MVIGGGGSGFDKRLLWWWCWSELMVVVMIKGRGGGGPRWLSSEVANSDNKEGRDGVLLFWVILSGP